MVVPVVQDCPLYLVPQHWWCEYRPGKRVIQFRLSDISGLFGFGLGMVRFGSISGKLIFGQICSSCQNKQLCGKFRFGYGSIRVNLGFGSNFGWAYFGVGSSIGPGHSVRVLGLGSVFPGLLTTLKPMGKRRIPIDPYLHSLDDCW